MWRIGELKKKSRGVLRKNYWSCVTVCFFLAILVGEFGCSTVFIYCNKEIKQTGAAIYNMKSNNHGDVVLDLINSISDVRTEEIPVLTHILDFTIETKTTTNDNFFFHLIDGLNKLVFQHKIVTGIILILSSFIAILYTVFFANIFVIGSKRFFMENRRYHGTRASRSLCLFRMKEVIHPAKVMFLRWLFNFLWTFTIIGGVIKYYEYRMIPYILAEYPELDYKSAFQLSKRLMRGHKWKTFLLDASFILWDIGTILTFGLLGFFYVNPYRAQTNAELYMFLRNEAIENQVEGYQLMKDEYL